jgi:hypothetical protein
MNLKIAILSAALFAMPSAQAERKSYVQPPSEAILAASTNALMLGGFCQGGSSDRYVIMLSEVMADFWESENARLETHTKKFRALIAKSVMESERKLAAFIKTKSPAEALYYCNMEYLKKVQYASYDYSRYITKLQESLL